MLARLIISNVALRGFAEISTPQQSDDHVVRLIFQIKNNTSNKPHMGVYHYAYTNAYHRIGRVESRLCHIENFFPFSIRFPRQVEVNKLLRYLRHFQSHMHIGEFSSSSASNYVHSSTSPTYSPGCGLHSATASLIMRDRVSF